MQSRAFRSLASLIVGFVLLGLCPTSASANDTSAQLAAGGLVLTRSDTIEMQTEDLTISRSKVEVRYTFLNTSAKDVVTRVAFPLPAVGGRAFFESDISIPDDASDNFLAFETRVGGKPVAMQVEQKARAGNADRTAWLRAHNIPLAPHRGPAQDALDALLPPALAEAKRLGLIDEDGYPAWELETTYHWLQRFPAGVPVVVEHHYTPSVGATVATMLGQDPEPGSVQHYCIDPSLLSTLRRADQRGVIYAEQWLDYILVTGGNWSKPIGTFRLTIDKERVGDLVSFCGDGVRKVGPTRFEMIKTNWRPQEDLSILFLKRRSAGSDGQ